MPNKVMQTEAIRSLCKNYKFDFDDDVFNINAALSDDLLDLLKGSAIEFTLRSDGKNIRQGRYFEQMGKQVEISIRRGALNCEGNIYGTWEQFLEFKANLFTCPDFFWIISDNIFFNKEENNIPTSDVFKHYLDACSFIELLIKVSDYQDRLSDDVVESVIFLSKSKLEIHTCYELSELANGLDGITVVLTMFSDNLHLEHKNCILKEVLHSLLSNVPETGRLKYLFEHFGEFSTRLTDNYQLFVSEFSFDSVRSEYEEKKRDYIIKLNNVLASVQSKMLGIPVSLAFLSLKYDSTKVDNVISDHIALSAGIIIYCVMMLLLIANQFHTLTAVKDEYNSLMGRLKYKHAAQHKTIEGIVDNLDIRYNFQWRTLAFFNFITYALLLSILYLAIF